MYTHNHISHFGQKIYNIIINSQFKTSIYNIIINSQFKTSIDISHINMIQQNE